MPALQRGDTFYYGDGGHLWVVVSDPANDGGIVLAVNITKDWFRAGSECELFPGEHPWITCKSYVNFGDPPKFGPAQAANFAKGITSGTIRTHLSVTVQLLHKIVEAGKESEALSDEMKALL